MQIRVNQESELDRAAAELLDAAAGACHIALIGEMGAGKTTLTSAMARRLGVTDDVSSPTFSIVNEYNDCSGETVMYHFDFYRVESDEEAVDLGLDEYFDSKVLCVMEWPEKVEKFLPDDLLVVRITVEPDGSRIINLDNL